MSEIDANAIADEPAAPKAGGKRKLLIAAILIAVVLGGGAAAWFGGLLGPADVEEHAPSTQPPIYYEIDANLIVNFQAGNRVRYLQIGVQAMTRDPAVVEVLKQHHPLIRNNLILLFSEQTQETLSSREGKAALAEAALAEVQSIVREQFGEPGVEAVYFTTFVMQ